MCFVLDLHSMIIWPTLYYRLSYIEVSRKLFKFNKKKQPKSMPKFKFEQDSHQILEKIVKILFKNLF